MDKRMRTTQKKQIEDTINLIHEAHSAVKKAMETGNEEMALNLLEQCQDSAIQIGNLIEETEGEGFVTIGLLESYCEQVYQAYELIRQQQSINIDKMYKNMCGELIQIANSVKNDIKAKTVAVFLPYKASMWDSLESVWQAADADPDCDAYVVPIPYYDKNSDGSFGEMHYEGSEYPDYVPIVSWKEYDFITEHPDVIFIHNPYDEFNLITSVPPMYYSKELRECTDKLVYIPYFVLEEIEPDNKEAVEGIEHFCTVPAVAYADNIIVQSEKMRQIYINVLSKSMGEDTRKIWKKKILGLGSPKIDRVLKTQRDKLSIPEEWLRIIEKPDGSWKKIIFYNTSVSALLYYNEGMLNKMEYVFSTFKENKDNVTLLWRPHPLIKATIESMRPQLWEEYNKIVTKYQEDGWGIYDDTADIERAIALSDAYYGDHSSIVQMYNQTGKPVMIQNVDISVRESRIKMAYYSYARVDKKIYFSHIFLNGLFEMDLDDFSVRFIGHFPGFPISGGWTSYLHNQRATVYNDRIYFYPQNGRLIQYYDLGNGEINSISIPLETAEAKDRYFQTVYKWEKGNKVWIFPFTISKGVFMLDMDNQSIRKADLLTKTLSKYELLTNYVAGQEGKVYTCSISNNTLIEIDVEMEEVKEYSIMIEGLKIGTINYHKGKFWILDKCSGNVYEWEIGNKNTRMFTAEKLEWISIEGMPFTASCCVADQIYIIPYKSRYIMKVDEDSGLIVKAVDYPVDFCFSERDEIGGFSTFEIVKDEIWLHPTRGNQLLIYNAGSNQITGKELSVDVGAIFSYEGYHDETQSATLDILCHTVKKAESNMEMKENSCGEKIYKCMVENF